MYSHPLPCCNAETKKREHKRTPATTFPEPRSGKSPQNQWDSALPWVIWMSCKEGSPAVQERGKQHVDVWDNGTSQPHLGASLCLGLTLLVTTSLQESFLECRNSQILLYTTKSWTPHPTLSSNEEHIHGASNTKQHLITADQMTWLVYILKKIDLNLHLIKATQTLLTYFISICSTAPFSSFNLNNPK